MSISISKTKLLECKSILSDTFYLGPTCPHGSQSAASLIRSIRFKQVEPLFRFVRVIPQEIKQAMSKSGRHEFQHQEAQQMNAVGIDVSKGRSTVAILRPMGEVVRTPIMSCAMQSVWSVWRIRSSHSVKIRALTWR